MYIYENNLYLTKIFKVGVKKQNDLLNFYQDFTLKHVFLFTFYFL